MHLPWPAACLHKLRVRFITFVQFVCCAVLLLASDSLLWF